jgi:hypothetical protein
MDSEQRLSVLQEVLDVDWSIVNTSMDEDLLKFVRAVVTDEVQAWYDDDAFIDVLLDNFPDDHPLWEFIRLD